MIRPLIPYGLKGIVWYQGESNCDGNGDPYAAKLKHLIHSWKNRWGQENLPIYTVQLTAFGTPEDCNPDSPWARIREAQSQTNQLAGDGLAVIMDAGDADTIHPLDEKTVGRRLAGIVRGDEASMAPALKTYRMENHQVILWFDHAEGLQGQDGFFFPDAQGNLKPADVLIDENKVTLSHPDIPRPTVIYYQWADNQSCHGLHNRYGIPAEPFRLIP